MFVVVVVGGMTAGAGAAGTFGQAALMPLSRLLDLVPQV